MIAERVAEYVDEMGIRRNKLADACGIKPQSMSQMLLGKRAMKAEEYKAICKYLKVPYGTFMEEGEER